MSERTRPGGRLVPSRNRPLDAPSQDELDYAQRFHDLAEVLEQCAHSEEVALLLSTCRNCYLTVNAVFVDVAAAIRGRSSQSTLERALHCLDTGKSVECERHLDAVRALLDEAELKLKVWTQRQDLNEELNEVLERQTLLVRERVRQTVHGDVNVRDGLGNEWDRRFYEFNLAENAALEEKLSTLANAVGASHVVRRVARRLARISASAGPSASSQGSLLGPDIPEDAWTELGTAIEEGADVLDLSVRKEGSAMLLVPPAVEGAEIAWPLEAPTSVDGLRPLVSALCGVLGGTVERLARDLAAHFRPNVDRTPLPPPFRVDLSVVAAQAGGSKSFHVNQLRAGAQGKPSSVRLGLLRWPIPHSWYGANFRYDADSFPDIRQRVGAVLTRSVEVARDMGVNVLIFPEYFLPQALISDVITYARESDVVIVTGVEARWEDGRLVNEGLIALPGFAHGFFQQKQHPSVYEPRPEMFSSDGTIQVFSETSIGSFAVVMCSDYMRMSLVAEIAAVRPRVDFLVLLSRNPRPELFTPLIRADAVRLYSYVAAVNTWTAPSEAGESATTVGTFVASPELDLGAHRWASAESVALTVGGTGKDAAELVVSDLSLAGLDARLHGKPADGFMNPPPLD